MRRSLSEGIPRNGRPEIRTTDCRTAGSIVAKTQGGHRYSQSRGGTPRGTRDPRLRLASGRGGSPAPGAVGDVLRPASRGVGGVRRGLSTCGPPAWWCPSDWDSSFDGISGDETAPKARLLGAVMGVESIQIRCHHGDPGLPGRVSVRERRREMPTCSGMATFPARAEGAT